MTDFCLCCFSQFLRLLCFDCGGNTSITTVLACTSHPASFFTFPDFKILVQNICVVLLCTILFAEKHLSDIFVQETSSALLSFRSHRYDVSRIISVSICSEEEKFFFLTLVFLVLFLRSKLAYNSILYYRSCKYNPLQFLR